MDYTKLRAFFWLTVAGSGASLVSLVLPQYRLYSMIALFVLVPGAFILETWTGMLSVFRSGMNRFYCSFPVNANHAVFDRIVSEYCYLGISFDTIFSQFEDWYRFRRPLNAKVRILLLDFSAKSEDVLRFQIQHQSGDAGESTTQVDLTRRRIEDRVLALMSLPQANDVIEIRFHREKLRHWMHLIDGKWAWIGLLPKGKPGIEAPVILLKRRRPGDWEMLDLYREEFEALWNAGQQWKAVPVPSEDNDRP